MDGDPIVRSTVSGLYGDSSVLQPSRAPRNAHLDKLILVEKCAKPNAKLRFYVGKFWARWAKSWTIFSCGRKDLTTPTF
jgi:hypothetical protein